MARYNEVSPRRVDERIPKVLDMIRRESPNGKDVKHSVFFPVEEKQFV